MAEELLIRVVLAVIVGVLFGIVYCMRVLVLMERRVAKIERHIDRVVSKILRVETAAHRPRKKQKKRCILSWMQWKKLRKAKVRGMRQIINNPRKYVNEG